VITGWFMKNPLFFLIGCLVLSISIWMSKRSGNRGLYHAGLALYVAFCLLSLVP
jgi:hypothetical protein